MIKILALELQVFKLRFPQITVVNGTGCIYRLAYVNGIPTGYVSSNVEMNCKLVPCPILSNFNVSRNMLKSNTTVIYSQHRNH